MLLVENLFPVQIGIIKYWIHIILRENTMTILYTTGYKRAVGAQMGRAKEKGVVHSPQLVVVCR